MIVRRRAKGADPKAVHLSAETIGAVRRWAEERQPEDRRREISKAEAAGILSAAEDHRLRGRRARDRRIRETGASGPAGRLVLTVRKASVAVRGQEPDSAAGLLALTGRDSRAGRAMRARLGLKGEKHFSRARRSGKIQIGRTISGMRVGASGLIVRRGLHSTEAQGLVPIILPVSASTRPQAQDSTGHLLLAPRVRALTRERECHVSIDRRGRVLTEARVRVPIDRRGRLSIEVQDLIPIVRVPIVGKGVVLIAVRKRVLASRPVRASQANRAGDSTGLRARVLTGDRRGTLARDRQGILVEARQTGPRVQRRSFEDRARQDQADRVGHLHLAGGPAAANRVATDGREDL